MPLPRRALTALMTRLNGSSLLIDCGEGTQVAIREKGWSMNPIDVICFTHYHGDHIGGLPGLLLSMGNAERTEPVTMIGPKGLEKIVNSLLVIARGLPFDIRFVELEEPFQSLRINDYVIEAFKVNHNVTCYAYTLKVPRAGKFHLEMAKENDVPMPLWSKLQKGATVEWEGRTYTPDLVLGPPRQGIKLTYCTDTRPTPTIVERADGSNLFICEGMYGERGKDEKANEYKHMTLYEAADLARRANVDQLWLTHYSPSMAWPGEYMKRVKDIFPNATAGKDGMSVELDFMEE